ncbi:MAG TPA: cbb3-type cytochrome oxidase assembly protein CcoS [Sedimenticola thiotaurini]|uniref:Cbb3-type cytochrome oxidase assembly protein CcoS n=1 Tax=Sedimenticola thiotaurini TaxID=1543721 RepID=A0A831RLW6_9GAMM|nr:cbb3-type cytochrome oxidase assembly protein CcoS [Sedimenticola thiotaurini]
MDVIYGLIPGMILLGLIAVAVFFWAARSGQFDDLEGEANRILMDEDLPPEQPNSGRDGDDGSAAGAEQRRD